MHKGVKKSKLSNDDSKKHAKLKKRCEKGVHGARLEGGF